MAALNTHEFGSSLLGILVCSYTDSHECCGVSMFLHSDMVGLNTHEFGSSLLGILACSCTDSHECCGVNMFLHSDMVGLNTHEFGSSLLGILMCRCIGIHESYHGECMSHCFHMDELNIHQCYTPFQYIPLYIDMCSQEVRCLHTVEFLLYYKDWAHMGHHLNSSFHQSQADSCKRSLQVHQCNCHVCKD